MAEGLFSYKTSLGHLSLPIQRHRDVHSLCLSGFDLDKETNSPSPVETGVRNAVGAVGIVGVVVLLPLVRLQSLWVLAFREIPAKIMPHGPPPPRLHK